MNSKSPLKTTVSVLFILVGIFIAIVGIIRAVQSTDVTPLFGTLLLAIAPICIGILIFMSQTPPLNQEFTHVSGLPIADGMTCRIEFLSNKLIFHSGNAEIVLDTSKITDMSIMSNTEIQKQYVSSIGGAIGGGLIFGSIGAAIGGRTKLKDIEYSTNYLVITYKKDEDLKYICFDVTSNMNHAQQYVNRFKGTESAPVSKIEL